MPEISEEDLRSLNEAKTQAETLSKELESLKGDNEKLKAATSDLERKLDEADQELLSEDYLNFKDKKSHPPASSGSGDEGDFDYDRASGKDLAAHLSNKSKADLKKAIEMVNDRIGKNEEQMNKAFAKLDVALTAIRHPDFDTNREAIYKIAKSNPSWNAERCYKQWKLESKAEADQKAEEAKAKEAEERRALSERGEGVPSSTTQGKQLSKEEAAAAAYEKAFGNSEKA